MLGAIGQFETEIRKERQMEGIAKAKNKGVYSGRKNKLDEVKIVELKQKRENGVLIKDLMKEFNISKASVYRYLI
jgi:DNA invertase Pin-like site-specific DNA recombinase